MSAHVSSNLQKHISGNPLQRWLIERFHRAAAHLMAQTDACSALDAGCGEGFAMRYLLHDQTRAGPITGLDGSYGALLVARHLNPQRGFVSGNLYALPFPDRCFDLVLCMEVLEHLDNPADGLTELCRVSRRWLLLSVPDEPLFRGANFLRGKHLHAWGNDPGHVQHWSATRFVRFVSAQCQVISWQRSFPWTLVLCSNV